MDTDFYKGKICPHCRAVLSVPFIEEERILSRCPSCHQMLIVADHGATLKAPTIYTCPKCNKNHYYDGRPPYVICDECHSIYKPSDYGYFLLDAGILDKGDKGELPFTKKPDRLIATRNNWRRMPFGKKALLLGAVVTVLALFVGIYILSQPPSIENSMAYAQMDSVWTEFRDKNPYAHQLEGMRKFEDGSYLVVLSEPNESVSMAQLKRMFKRYNAFSKVYQKGIGYDGWLKDAVFVFNDLKEKRIPSFSSKLFSLLHGTDYKAELIDLEVIPEHVPFSSSDLNVEVTEEELRSWFVDENEPLLMLEDTTKEVSFKQLLEEGQGMQLCMSKQPGFIVWAMDTGMQDLASFKVAARKFALDSDLILGAITQNQRLAVIARERCVPVYELPPMREETLCLLAGTAEDELSQSYERTTLFAGKLPGGKDFAPIYLSDELWHTEYGNILNVTDQMLKSWSENGMIDYVDFHYPKPVNWAFLKGVSGDLGVSELTYNWNTAGVGYIVEDEDYSVYALNRTGSLPVSYIPGDSEGISEKNPVYEAEQQAYDFFSSLSAPELVRVVQYTAMYQIFRNIGVSVPQNHNLVSGVVTVPEDLRSKAHFVINSLYDFNDGQIDKIADYYGVPVRKASEKPGRGERSLSVSTGRSLIYKPGENESSFYSCADLILSMKAIHSTLSRVSSDDALKSSLGSLVVDRNADIRYTSNALTFQIPISGRSHYSDVQDAVSAVSGNGYTLQRYAAVMTGLSTRECRDLYVTTNQVKSHAWMKCPTIVESWSLKDSSAWVGGHNLDSKITSFKVSKELKPGETRRTVIDGKEVVEVSPFDRRAHITDQGYLRRVGRLGNSDIKGPEVVTRTRAEAMPSVKERTARGFNVADHQSPVRIKLDAKAGHELNGKRYVDFEAFLNDVGAAIEEGRAQFRQIEIEGLQGAGVDVDVFIDGVAGRMRKGNCSSLPMSQFDFAHKTVTFEGDRAVVTIPIKPGKVQFGSTSQIVEAGMGGSSTSNPAVRIKGGKVDFNVPRSKLRGFLDMIDGYLAKQKGYWNDFGIKIRMKQKGISPSECQERTMLRVAFRIELIKHEDDVWIIQETAVA